MNRNISNLQETLKELKLDAILITSPINIIYLSDFLHLSPTEREAYMIVTQEHAFFITYSTIIGLVNKRKDGIEYICMTRKFDLFEVLKTIIKESNIKKLGYEKQNLTVGELEIFEEKITCQFVKTQNLLEDLRIQKSKDEIEKIKKAAELTDTAYIHIQTKIKKGVSEKDIALEIEWFFKRLGADIAFTPIVAFDEGSAIPHYYPSPNKKLTQNNLILLDFGAKYEGYHADMTRVLFFGSPNEKKHDVYNTVLAAETKAIKSLKPGTLAETPDIIAKEVITKKGYVPYLHGLGHGVGLAIHEKPRLRNGIKEPLQENMVITIEPGIYIEGLCGVRIEDLVVLRKDGIEVLSKSSKDIIIL